MEVKNVRQSNMFHLHGLSPDGMNGYSVARVGAESLGRGLAANKFSSSFFSNGASPSGVLSHPMHFDKKEDIERLSSQFQKVYSGEQGWNKPLILEQGMTWTPISVPPEDAQLIETEKFSVLDVARWLRIGPHKLAELGDSNFSTIEEQNIDHVTDTLMPWLARWEAEAARKLFVDDRFFAEHQVQALLRGNQEDRAAFYREQFNVGALSQNDIREMENLNPIEGGDTYYINGSLVRSEDASRGMTGATSSPPDGRTDGNDNRRRMEAILLECLGRCQAKERMAIEAAQTKHDGPAFTRWLGGFYHRHKSYLSKQFSIAVGAIEVAYDVVVDREELEMWSTEYARSVLESTDSDQLDIKGAGDKIIGRILFHCCGRTDDA